MLEPVRLFQKIVVIAGATATGKTRLAIDLATQFNGEVVNADSRYLYRGIDIGVAKPSFIERKGVPHHLIDIREPDEEMSLATFQELAYAAVAQVHSRERLPLLTGGTPLYLNAVVEGWRIPRVPPNEEVRSRLEREIEIEGLDVVAGRLASIDPTAFQRSQSNPRRVIRALEVWETTGRPMSELEGKGPPPYDALELGLRLPRQRLYDAIDKRIDDQIDRGLIDEVRVLLESGLDPGASSMSSIGYRQLAPYLAGTVSLEDAIEQIKSATRRYVRHQETWLRRNQRLHWIDVDQSDWIERAAGLVTAFIQSPKPQ